MRFESIEKLTSIVYLTTRVLFLVEFWTWKDNLWIYCWHHFALRLKIQRTKCTKYDARWLWTLGKKIFLANKHCYSNTIMGGGSHENYKSKKYSILNVNPVGTSSGLGDSATAWFDLKPMDSLKGHRSPWRDCRWQWDKNKRRLYWLRVNAIWRWIIQAGEIAVSAPWYAEWD